MPARDTILGRIRAATAAIRDKQPHPEFDEALLHAAPRLAGTDIVEVFTRNFTAVNGRVVRSIDELVALLRQLPRRYGFCDRAVFEAVGRPLFDAGFGLDTVFDRAAIDSFAFGITPATAAIAESGTLVLDDHHTSDRLGALAPWVHVAVVDPATIVRTIPEALARLGDSPTVVWVTGPSKTADVEGILIEGVHGPGEEVALIL